MIISWFNISHPVVIQKNQSLQVIPHSVLNNIALIPTIKEDVTIAQKTNAGMSHIRREIGVRQGEVFPRRCRWSLMVQGLSCGSKRF
jgi:hypothetical protein